jgi:Outer membrane protein beta-barrel family
MPNIKLIACAEKRKKIFNLLILLFITTEISNAQTGVQVKLTGKIETINGIPIEFVTVSLYNSDSTYMSGSVSDDSGNFSITTAIQGNFYLKCSNIGYETLFVTYNGVEIRNNSYKLGVLKMKKDSATTLSEVSVISKRKVFERKIDRLVFNVNQNITAGSNSLLEILNKAPGVRADNNGGVSVVGKNSIVLIDGKQVQLSGEDLTDFLRGKQADIIERVEVYVNPPAKFDAQGASVINIITKKRKTAGYDGTFRATYKQGFNARYALGTVLNYSNRQFRFSANYSYAPSVFRTTEDEYVDYSLASGSISSWRMRHVRRADAWSHDASFSVEYNPGKNHAIGIQTDGFLKGSTGIRTIGTVITSGSGTLDSSLNTVNRSFPKRNQGNANFYYKFTTDTLGGSLSLNLNINHYQARTIQEIKTNSFDAFQNIKPNVFGANSNSDQRIFVKSFKIDWSKPIDSKTEFAAGLKIVNSETDNDIVFKLQQPGGGYVTDPGRTNIFTYNEEIKSGYINGYHNFGKFGVQVGLRGEYTATKGVSKTANIITRNDYFRLFPTVYLQYDVVPDKHQLTLSYGKRIRRPDYWRLNPFQFYTTPYSYLQGNPFLQPSFNHSADITYNLKNTYSLTIYYNYTSQPFTNITNQNNLTGELVNNQVNLKNNSDLGIYTSIPLNFTKWWEGNVFIQGARKAEVTIFDNAPVTLKNWFGYVNYTNSFEISKKKSLRAEVNLWYASPGIQGIYRLKSTNDISLSVRKGFWKNKGQLTLGIQDLFYGNIYRINVDYKNQRNGFTEKNDTRMFTLNFLYRFSKNNTTKIRQRRTGAEDEKSRLGNL